MIPAYLTIDTTVAGDIGFPIVNSPCLLYYSPGEGLSCYDHDAGRVAGVAFFAIFQPRGSVFIAGESGD